METKQIIDKKSEYWKKKLIDLSNRNNLVSYRFTKSKSLQVKQPEAKQIIENLYHESNVHILKKENGKPKERLWLCTEDEEVVNKQDWYLMMQLSNDNKSIFNYINPGDVPIIIESIEKTNDFLQKAKEIDSIEKKIATIAGMEIYAIKHNHQAFLGLRA